MPTLGLTAKLQVKGTKGTGFPRVKLRNWLRAVDDPLAWFFLCIRFDTHNNITEAALIHVDAEQVERVLRKLYKLPIEQRASLHKHTLQLRWADKHRLPLPPGPALRSRICKAVGGDPTAYASEKRRWYKERGSPSHLVTVYIEGDSHDDLHRRLARAAIGLDDGLEITRMTHSTTRFGVTESDATVHSGSLRVNPSGEMRWTLLASRMDGAGTVALPCTMRFSAAVFPILPKEHWLFRCTTPLLDMVITLSGNTDITVSLSEYSETPSALATIAPSFSFIQLLHRANDTGIAVSLERDATTAKIGRIEGGVRFPTDIARLAESVCTLVRFAGDVGADPATPITLNEAELYGPIATVMLAARHGSPTSLLAECTVGPHAVALDQPMTVITDLSLSLGSITYSDVIAFTEVAHVLETTEKTIRLRVQSRVARSLSPLQHVRNNPGALAWDTRFDHAIEQLEADGITNVITAPRHLGLPTS